MIGKITNNLVGILIGFLLMFFSSITNMNATTFQPVEEVGIQYVTNNIPEFRLNTLLILGAGSDFGSDYKVDIFKTLRPYAKHIYVCEVNGNKVIPKVKEDSLVDYFLPVCSSGSKTAYKELIDQLRKYNIQPDAVVTYREEWVEIKNMISKDFGLPHSSLEAVFNSQSKKNTRETLQKIPYVIKSQT